MRRWTSKSKAEQMQTQIANESRTHNNRCGRCGAWRATWTARQTDEPTADSASRESTPTEANNWADARRTPPGCAVRSLRASGVIVFAIYVVLYSVHYCAAYIFMISYCIWYASCIVHRARIEYLQYCGMIWNQWILYCTLMFWIIKWDEANRQWARRLHRWPSGSYPRRAKCVRCRSHKLESVLPLCTVKEVDRIVNKGSRKTDAGWNWSLGTKGLF